jgi:hypothetical protein
LQGWGGEEFCARSPIDIPTVEIDNSLTPAPLCGGFHRAAIHEEIVALPLRLLANLARLQELGLQRLALLLLQRGEVLVEAPSRSGQFGPGPENRVAGFGSLELQQQHG